MGKSTNVAICAFTTAYARLRLYQALEILGEDVLYCDTDSVIFRDRGQLVTGPYLGDLTSELKPGEFIEEFCSTGPKSYSYRTNTGKVECKIKGFTLDAKVSTVLNFESMKKMVLEDRRATLTVPQLNFAIATNHTISTTPNYQKQFSFTFDKRKIMPLQNGEIDTQPLT